MAKIAIFFGSDTGRTRLIAKQMAKKQGEAVEAPVNIGRTTLAEFLAWHPGKRGKPALAQTFGMSGYAL